MASLFSLHIQGLDEADKEMAKAQQETDTADFQPAGFQAKARIKELRGMVEIAVGCAFEEDLFNKGEKAGGGGKGDGRTRTPTKTSRGGGAKGRNRRPGKGGKGPKRRGTRRR